MSKDCEHTGQDCPGPQCPCFCEACVIIGARDVVKASVKRFKKGVKIGKKRGRQDGKA